MKKCTHCKELKATNEFNRSATGFLGLHNHCRKCQKLVRRRWYLRNQEHEKSKARIWHHSDAGKRSNKRSYRKNRLFILERNRVRRRTPHARALANAARNKKHREDFNFRLSINLRTRVRKALHGLTKASPTVKLLGCSIVDLKQHLESQFKPDMSWSNYGYRGWHIDHIIPCSHFDLSKRENQFKCFHYTNLQPLWWTDNLSKHNRLT